MPLRFVLLGSGAVRSNPRRTGPSQILCIGDRVLMFGCGRAAGMRLRQAGVVIKHLVIEDITGDLNAAEGMAATIRSGYRGEVTVGEDGLEIEL